MDPALTVVLFAAAMSTVTAFICSSREHLTHGPDLLWFGPFLLYSMPCARTEKWNLKRVQDDGCAGT